MDKCAKGKQSTSGHKLVSVHPKSSASNLQSHGPEALRGFREGTQLGPEDIKHVLKELGRMRKLLKGSKKKKKRRRAESIRSSSKEPTHARGRTSSPSKGRKRSTQTLLLTGKKHRDTAIPLSTTYSASINASTALSTKRTFLDTPGLGHVRSFLHTGPQVSGPSSTLSYIGLDNSSNFNSLKLWLDDGALPSTSRKRHVQDSKKRRAKKKGATLLRKSPVYTRPQSTARLLYPQSARRKNQLMIGSFSPQPDKQGWSYPQSEDFIHIQGEHGENSSRELLSSGAKALASHSKAAASLALGRPDRTLTIPPLDIGNTRQIAEQEAKDAQSFTSQVEKTMPVTNATYKAIQLKSRPGPKKEFAELRRIRELEHKSARKIQRAYRQHVRNHTLAPKTAAAKHNKRLMIDSKKVNATRKSSKSRSRSGSRSRSQEKKKDMGQNLASIETMLKSKLALHEKRRKQHEDKDRAKASKKERENTKSNIIPDMSARSLAIHSDTVTLSLQPAAASKSPEIVRAKTKEDKAPAPASAVQPRSSLEPRQSQTGMDSSGLTSRSRPESKDAHTLNLDITPAKPEMSHPGGYTSRDPTPPQQPMTKTRSEELRNVSNKPGPILKTATGRDSGNDQTCKRSDTSSRHTVGFKLEDAEEAKSVETDHKAVEEVADNSQGAEEQALDDLEGCPITIRFIREGQIVQWSLYFKENDVSALEQGEGMDGTGENTDDKGAIETEMVAFTTSRRDVVACRDINFERTEVADAGPDFDLPNWTHISVLIPNCLEIFRNLSYTAVEYGLSLWEDDPDLTDEVAPDQAQEQAIGRFLKEGWISRAPQLDINTDSVVRALSTLESSYPRCSAQIEALADVSAYATWALVQKLKNRRKSRLGVKTAVELFSKDIVEECLREISHLFVLYRDLNGRKLKLTRCTTSLVSEHQRTEYARILSASLPGPIVGNQRKPRLELQPSEREINLNLNNVSVFRASGEGSRGALTDRGSMSPPPKLPSMRDMHSYRNLMKEVETGPLLDEDDDDEDYKDLLEPMQKLDERTELQMRRQATTFLQTNGSAATATVNKGEAVAQELERLERIKQEFRQFRYYTCPFKKEYPLRFTSIQGSAGAGNDADSRWKADGSFISCC